MQSTFQASYCWTGIDSQLFVPFNFQVLVNKILDITNTHGPSFFIKNIMEY